ncbi:helix-turn-helix transcriptional regulator [Dechloromonas hortensis]|uniref:helix-turn-helix transcriptional regulator n=1 Tax=Dechloromonas hortensis TaxID=337779 RepID=UPI00129194DF
MANEFLTIEDVCARLKVSRATIYRWIKCGNFLAPVKIGGSAQQSAARWSERAVSAWIDQKCGVA